MLLLPSVESVRWKSPLFSHMENYLSQQTLSIQDEDDILLENNMNTINNNADSSASQYINIPFLT
jgi:hypothetical protein